MREISIISAEKTAVKKNLAKALTALQDAPDSKEKQAAVVAYEQQLREIEQEHNDAKLSIKQTKALAVAEADEQYKRELSLSTLTKIEQHEVVQIIETKNYFVKEEDGRYYPRDLTQIDREIFRFVNKAHQNDFHALLEENKRNFLSWTYSFTETNPRVFNMAANIREHWLQPVPYTGEVKEFQCPTAIDLLFTSLSGGNQEVRDHLEEVIIRKYRQPGDYKIPNLFLFGEGGVGKNELITEFLSHIFVDSYGTTNFKTLTENAWSIVGKCVVLVDETISSKTDYEKFKSIAGNREFLVKKLFSDVVSIPNIMLLVVSGQGHDGPLSITDDGTTRRFSAIHYTRHLFHWLADLIGHGEYDGVKDEGMFKEVWDKMKRQDFTAENIAQWLGWVSAKFPEDRPVQAYHGEAYRRMVEAHKNPEVSLIDDVILPEYDDKPSSFELNDLYILYKEYTRYYFEGRKPLGRNKFVQAISGLAASNKIPGWEYRERQSWVKGVDKGQAKMLVPKSHEGRAQRDYDASVFMEYENGRVVRFLDWKKESTAENTTTYDRLLTLKGR